MKRQKGGRKRSGGEEFKMIIVALFLIAIYENDAFDLTATLNKPLLKQNNLPIFDLDDNCILSCTT